LIKAWTKPVNVDTAPTMSSPVEYDRKNIAPKISVIMTKINPTPISVLMAVFYVIRLYLIPFWQQSVV
jgi:hypothetical protein